MWQDCMKTNGSVEMWQCRVTAVNVQVHIVAANGYILQLYWRASIRKEETFWVLPSHKQLEGGSNYGASSKTVLVALCGALPDPTLSYPTLSYPILSYPILPYPTLSYLILSYPILSYFILSYLILSYPILSYFTLSYPTQSYPILFYPTLSYPTYPILPYPILP